ncbi:MAG: M23 family metallopeptidase [Cellulosilyticaceae bacterium]
MSGIQRFLSQKVYEWQRKKARKGQRKGVSTGGGQLPKIIGFKIEGGKVGMPSLPGVSSGNKRPSSRRRRNEGAIDIKKVIGVALIAIGCVLILGKCFGGGEEKKPEKEAATEVRQEIAVDFESYVQDLIISEKEMHRLQKYTIKHRMPLAHTLGVWALTSYEGKSSRQLSQALKEGQGIEKDERYQQAFDVYKQFIYDVEVFPIGKPKSYVYENGWKQKRSYKGERLHYGIDLMAKEDKPGVIEIVSMTNGVVENVGWNEVGGYRVGIRSEGGAYFYYAHLDEAPTSLKKGDYVYAGQTIGCMGNSGYGVEGTKGKFPVHLHLGIAVEKGENKEYWVNPYSLLKYLERYGRF